MWKFSYFCPKNLTMQCGIDLTLKTTLHLVTQVAYSVCVQATYSVVITLLCGYLVFKFDPIFVVSSVGRAPTWATEPSVQMDLESGTICRRTSDSRNCHPAVSDSRSRHFYFVSMTKASETTLPIHFKLRFINPSFLLTYLSLFLFCRRRYWRT